MNSAIEEQLKREKAEKAKHKIDSTLKTKTGFISNKILQRYGKGTGSYATRHTLPKNLINDKTVVLKALDVDPYYFESISDRLKDDKDVAKKAMEASSHFFQFLSDRLRDDDELAAKAVKDDYNLYNFVSDRLKIDANILKLTDFKQFYDSSERDYEKEFITKHKIEKPQFLKIVRILKNKNKAVPINLLLNASEEIKKDKDLVIKSVLISKSSYKHASPHLQKDMDVIDAFIKNPNFNGNDIKQIDGYNKDIALRIVKKHPWIFASTQFTQDKDVILEAMKRKEYIHHSILPYIPDHMKEDKDIKAVLESKSVEHFSKKDNDNKPLIMKSVKKWNKFEFVSKRLQNDKDVVMAALKNPARRKHHPTDLLKFTSDKLRTDRDVVLQALDNRLRYSKKEFKKRMEKTKKYLRPCIKRNRN
jgi:hypothetical protein